jgi:acetylornithine deacetylase/succinyl-diaminopimelate desuccinylase-like protein
VNVLNDPDIGVTWIDKAKPSVPSPLDPSVVGPIEQVTDEFWPGVPVMPLMATGASDSLYLRNAHGRDERVGVQQFYESLQFLYILVKRLAS